MELDEIQYDELNKKCLYEIELLKELYYEEKFSVDTKRNEQDDNNERGITNFEYAPTSYSFLEYFFTKYTFNDEDHLVDFGCGKGRVLIMAANNQCPTLTGIEIDTSRYNSAKSNIEKFKLVTNNKSQFNLLNSDATNMILDGTTNKFFFFNPFHLKIYIKVIKCISASLKITPRKCWLLLYRPVPSTLQYIEKLGTFHKIDEVVLDIFGGYVLYAIYSNEEPDD